MNPKLIVLVRHGLSIRNQIRQGRRFIPDAETMAPIKDLLDHAVPITDEGREQARQTGAALRKEFGQFDALYTSGYLRTKQTAEGILTAYEAHEIRTLTVREDLLLREREQGHVHHMHRGQVQDHFPWFNEYFDIAGYCFTTYPGGESIISCYERFERFLEKLRRRPTEEKVCLVTHGDFIRGAIAHLEQWAVLEIDQRIRQIRTPPCMVTAYAYDPEKDRYVCTIPIQKYW